MIVCRTISEVRASLKGIDTGFVPTMGAFHPGHVSLMKEAKSRAGHCTVSSFVNPTQFGPSEDLSRYPRRTEQDLQMAEEAGVDVFFHPEPAEMYQERVMSIDPGPLALRLEGALRPGHFAGVCLVVLKLFNIVRPRLAVFGRKDLQQCAVINSMVKDFNVPLELVIMETVRESSGLAMSSRNDYLSPERRVWAVRFPRALDAACQQIRQGQEPAAVMESTRASLEDDGFGLDYLVMVDEDSLLETSQPSAKSRLAAAVRFSGIRLLDNMPISSRPFAFD